MGRFEQLNVYSFVNQNSGEPQQVYLFKHEELKAELVILPPGTSRAWYSHEDCDELFDVLSGQGTFLIEDKAFCGGPGKSVLVHAGVRHMLRNEGDAPWIMRATYHQRLYPRHIGRLIARTIRRRLGII